MNSYLPRLDDILNLKQIQSLELFFETLTNNTVDLITAAKIANAVNISCEKAVEILFRCETHGIIDRYYGIRCPECNGLIKKLQQPKIVGIHNCYMCDKEINISKTDIVTLFTFLKMKG